ncbi:ATP-binding protein [Streptococcus sp. H31]|uniref:ATP-binding protein n=1 Tax=Streptococcus huangxiaojuni TaxID=3237239 RepID=UPI0034A4248B
MSLSDVLNVADSNMLNNLWDFKENLFLKKDGSVFAIYRVPSEIINSVDDKEKENFKSLGVSVLSGLESYKDFEIARIPMDKDLTEMLNKLSEDIDWAADSADLAEYLLNQMIDHLYTSMGDIYDDIYYLIVPLKSIHISTDLKEVVSQSYRTVRNTTLSFIGMGEKVPVDWYEKYTRGEEILFNSLGLLDVERISTEENIFINLWQYRRGMVLNRAEEVRAVEASVENIDDVNLEFENVNVIKLSNYNDSSYVACLPIDEIPENVSYLHLEEALQGLNFPVESRFKVQFSSKFGFFSLPSRGKRSRRRLKNTQEEAEDAGDSQNSKVARGRYLLEDLKEKVDEGEPLVSYLHTLIITGETIDILKYKIDMLLTHLKSMGVKLVKAQADQLYLFYKNRFGEVLTSSDKNFIQPLPLEGFCENLFFITHKVGTDIGFPIGRVDNQIESWKGDYKSAIASSSKLVLANLLQANKTGIKGKVTSNPHAGVMGETGSGKSYLIKLLFTYHSLLKGQYLYIDPKNEIRVQYHRILKELEETDTFPELQQYIKSINYITLDAKSPENYGALDPIVFLDGQEATDLADSMIDLMLKNNTDEIEEAYLASIERVLNRKEAGEKVGMLHVFEDMMNSESKNVVNAGRNLWRKSQNSILSLCFSDGRNPALDLNHKITILGVLGLDLPKAAQKGEYSKSQLKSMVVIYGLSYFCKRFGERNPAVETLSVFDECWMLEGTPAGEELITNIKRVGRAYNNFMILGTQSVHDTQTESDDTGFGTVFAFLEEREIDDVLDYIRIEKNDTTRAWMGNMTMGQCIYYDTFGRKERITVDGMFDEITVLFNTVQTELKAV